MQIYINKNKLMFTYRYLMFKMREITIFRPFLAIFKHFNY